MVKKNKRKMDTKEYYNDPQTYLSYLAFCKRGGSPIAVTLVTLVRMKMGKDFKIPNGFLIDLACGSGTSIVTLSLLGFTKFLGTDFSEGMLSQLPEFTASHNITVEAFEMDLRTATVPATNATADMVTCCSALMYIENILHPFTEASRVLKSGGLLGFNLLIYKANSPQGKIHNFLDEDDVVMYVHPIEFVLQTLDLLGFEPINGYTGDNNENYVKGIDSRETTLLFRKK